MSFGFHSYKIRVNTTYFRFVENIVAICRKPAILVSASYLLINLNSSFPFSLPCLNSHLLKSSLKSDENMFSL